MIFWGKGRKKRWRGIKRAAAEFGWQAAMSLLGDKASNSMRRQFSAVLLRAGNDAILRAEHLVRRDLDNDPDDVEASIQLAKIVSAKGHWREAARRWKSLLERHPARIDREAIELARAAYLNSEDIQSVEQLARRVEGMEGIHQRWCREHDNIDRQALDAVAAASRGWPGRPLISVLMIHRGTNVGDLQAAMRSVMEQAYDRWNLAVVFGENLVSSLDAQIGDATRDPRVTLWTANPENFPQTTVAALEQATGDYCVLHDGVGLLASHALLFMAWEIARNPDTDWMYSDFDHIDERGLRHDPCLLGGPDPELNHVLQRGATSMIRTRIIRDDAEIKAALANPDDQEIVVSIAQRVDANRIKHVPSMLQHVRAHGPGEGPGTGAIDTIRRYFARSGQQVEMSELHVHRGLRIRFPIPMPAPLVSIIIPTRDALNILQSCLESLRERTRYPATEIIVVDNDSREPATLAYFKKLEQSQGIRVIQVAEPFNWSRLNNIAVRQARGSILCLLNNDVEAINEGWLEEMVSQVLRPDVGVVGAALWYPDGRLQHGGIEFAPGTGAASHALSGFRRPELPSRARVVQSFQAVTGACLVVRKDVYLAVDGMDEAALPVGYSDVDFCLKVAEQLGLRTVLTPYAELLHLESASRGRLASRADRVRHLHARRVLQNRWYEQLVDDPYCRAVPVPRKALQDSYPGARSRIGRYRCSPQTRLAFVHVPKAAGVSARKFLRQVFPSPSVLSLSARAMLRCYEGDQAALAQARLRLQDAIVLFGHFGWGFGAILQWPCVYGTILRDPVSRTISHYQHLFTRFHSPFADSVLAGTPLALLLKKGAIPGNLIVRKILGEAPEQTAWSSIAAHCSDGAGFSGFGLPDALWHRRYDEVLNAPDHAPDRDVAKVDRAMGILEREFAFVGRAESLEGQLESLVTAMGGVPAGALERANAAAVSERPELSSEDRTAAESYNRLDQMLYDRIAAMPGGYLLDAEKLSAGRKQDSPLPWREVEQAVT